MKTVAKENTHKEKMMASASLLFWKNGYGRTTMRNIAKAYGCKPANIYNFFPNKESILYEFLHSQIKLVVSLLEPLENDRSMNPEEQLRYFIFAGLNHALGYAKTSRSLFDIGIESLSPANRKRIVELRDRYDQILRGIIQRGIDAGEFMRTDVKLAAFSITSIIVRTVIWFSPQGELSIEQVADYVGNFVLGGLRGEPKNGRTKMKKKEIVESGDREV